MVKNRKGIASRDLVLALLFAWALLAGLSYYLLKSYQEEQIKMVYDDFVKKVLIQDIKK